MDGGGGVITEQWRDVAEFEGRYEVSNFGRMRSVARAVPSPRHGPHATRMIAARILVPQIRSGYLTMVLVSEAGDRIGKQIHRLVAETFIPNPLNYPEVNHLDADRTNSHVENLEWCTRAMNVAHSYKIGRRPIGTSHHFAQLQRDSGGRCLAAQEEFS